MMKNHYKQEFLTLEKRIKVISDSESGMSQRCVAKIYNCGKTQIQQILKNRQHIQKKWHQNGNKTMKRECGRTFKEINELTFSWFEGARSRGLPISEPLLQEKTLSFVNILKVENFKASNG
jgi:hypothetical protein